MTTWNIDTSHSGIQFTVRHLVVSKVRGVFERWQGSLEFDPQQPEASKVSVRIETASINTREPKRDEHLRGADFFDTAKHPAITFESRKVVRSGDGQLRVIGDLTLRGVTREVELETDYLGSAKDPWGAERALFEARASLSRGDYGLSWNQALEAGGVLVGDKIEIALEIQAVKAAATQAA